ncbi:hypothetical protein BRD00_10060 [Halobacteriales archaeon QS_8_69_26]|nr:MAG: hypothetical protein BRD00_10060 [Halobacteriales archaeon QS_8_69_26]
MDSTDPPGSDDVPPAGVAADAMTLPVFLLDAGERIGRANPACADLFGVDRDELDGATLSEYLPGGVVGRIEASARRARESGESDRIRLPPTALDCLDAHREVELTPVEDPRYEGCVGVVHQYPVGTPDDYLEYEAAARAVADPVYATDPEGDLRFVNPAFEEQFGYSTADIRTRDVHFSEITTAEGNRTVQDAIRDLLASPEGEGRATVDIPGITVDGRRLRMEASLALLPPTDEFTGVAGVLRDVTDRNRREEVLSVMNRTLRHNLRTQVNNVVMYAGYLADAVDDPDDARYAEKIQSSVTWLERLGETLRNLQEAVQEDRDGGDAMTVEELVDPVVEEHRREYPEATIEVSIVTEALVDVGPTAGYALEHVVENAVVHGGDPASVTVWAVDSPGAGWVELMVEDDGPGIPEDERAVVLGETDETQLRHGSGIGLWATRWIVEAFDGELAIENGTDGGTVVTLRFPTA